MCGILGAIHFSDLVNTDRLKSSLDLIAHRGPDFAAHLLIEPNSQGSDLTTYTQLDFSKQSSLLPIENVLFRESFKRKKFQVYLGHRRLSILDLKSRSNQPMSILDKKIWITYNGEIYNYNELKKELIDRGHKFQTKSDTEVILASYLEWGEEFVSKLNGMFAFGIYDLRYNSLLMARDRYGIKPLYFHHEGQSLVFSSEIKPILNYLNQSPALSFTALNHYFTFQNLFGSESLFEGIQLLPAGYTLKCGLNGNITTKQYWDFDFSRPDRQISFEDACTETLRLLDQAVKRQLHSDVPIGAYLSGGMDSGSIVGIASDYINRLNTFTAGFELSRVTGVEASFDERADSEMISYAFKTQHYEQVIQAGDLAHILNAVIRHMEDLRVGMSYSNYYIAGLASRFVGVSLSGVGGDELYGGYPWRYYRVMHSLGRDEYFQNYYNFWQRLVNDDRKPKVFTDQISTLMDFTSPRRAFETVFEGAKYGLNFERPEDHVSNSLYFEAKTFLHSLLLVGDKLAMAHSLEERFPFLDNDLVDFAMTIPIEYKIRNLDLIQRIDENISRKSSKFYMDCNDGKNVLRKALKKLLPEAVIRRKKQGFSSPDASWYRGENLEYVKSILLDENALLLEYIQKPFIEDVIDKHIKGENLRLLIWSLLSFETWCMEFRRN